jgi:cyclophilin family peptidyl-prolyl cis-trans isomerase
MKLPTLAIFKASKSKKLAVIALAAALLISTAVCYGAATQFGDLKLPFGTSRKPTVSSCMTEGPLTKVVMVAGPFDIHRKYRSMEGPFITTPFTVGDLVASKRIDLPEGMVNFIEKGGKPPAMMGGASSGPASGTPIGVVHDQSPPTLYWVKGVKLQVLDENDKILPTAEFICHWNLDVDPEQHTKLFPDAHPCVNGRLFSISQGETEQYLPSGYGVPVASNETLSFSFQAANRTTDQHRRIRHKLTIYFEKDGDLTEPITALYWYVPYIAVVTDRNSAETAEQEKKDCSMCLGTSVGLNAPNNVVGGILTDPAGRRMTGHWVIPTGEHTYTDTIRDERDQGFGQTIHQPIIRAAWTHVHPLCTRLSLFEVKKSGRKEIMAARCETKTNPGLLITHLDFITAPKEGIKLSPEDAHYEMQVTYNNPLDKPVDSMAAMGIFFQDDDFARPFWSLPDHAGASCMVNSSASKFRLQTAKKKGQLFPTYQTDYAPPLTEPKVVEVTTNCGPLDLYIDPTNAPHSATYMYNILTKGVEDGTRIWFYEKDFVMSFSGAIDKAPAYKDKIQKVVPAMRCLPLEPSPLNSNNLYALSLAHDPDVTDNGFGAFSIVLKKAPQLDKHFAVFGHLIPNAKTMKTMNAIEDKFHEHKCWIVSAKEI